MKKAIVQNKTEVFNFIISNIPNSGTMPQHVAHVPARVNRYPVNIAICSDEFTGARFGKSRCRIDKNPKKIGGGGRNKSSNKAYQIWIWDID